MMYHNHNLASMLLIILVSCLFNVRMATALGKDEDEGDLRASFTQGGQQQHQGEDELWEAKYMADKRVRVSPACIHVYVLISHILSTSKSLTYLLCLCIELIS